MNFETPTSRSLALLATIQLAYFLSLSSTALGQGNKNQNESGQASPGFEQTLKSVEPQVLAAEALKRGDPVRGSLLFHASSAACTGCHRGQGDATPLGPSLVEYDDAVSDAMVVEALLFPSRRIRKGFETARVLTDDGKVVRGMLVREDDTTLILRDAADLQSEIKIDQESIESRSTENASMMPSGLVSTLQSDRNFLDLVSYLLEIKRGGQSRATELMPTAEQLAGVDDTKDIDHAGIWTSLKSPRDLKAGQKIYQQHCINCHGKDGNTPSLATARAFGKQKLKFGADPYSMFTTLSRGNGLMGPARHLSPMERYQVVYYIRDRFMKGTNPDFVKVDRRYLESLPKGTDRGTFKPSPPRDYGPALASQLGRDVESALTVKLGRTSIGFDLHTMNQVGVWQDGFLDLNQTQHQRLRGEGYAQIDGDVIDNLGGWQWGHEGTLDYSQAGLLPRGPLPEKWLQYDGHYLFGDQLLLSYRVDGRRVLHLPKQRALEAVKKPNPDEPSVVRHILQIDAGPELLLAVAKPAIDPGAPRYQRIISIDKPTAETHLAAGSIAIIGERDDDVLGLFSSARVLGDNEGLAWEFNDDHGIVLTIPADTEPRQIEVVCFAGDGEEDLEYLMDVEPSGIDPTSMTRGGDLRWKESLETRGYLGFQQGGYAVDTISIPESTPWNTWFRTSAVDFFPDGRLVVATVGGDVWIVSGVDQDLMNLRWKRFAAGLYEPFGIKVVDGLIYVTCKDRLTRLHDLNADGEADYYESFSADTDVSTFFHAFNFDLQTDSHGNFYYAKAGQYTDYKLPGAVIKVSPDGKRRSVVCTGFRTPNGMGILPDDRLTVSDNQGTWMPASKVSLVKPGGFYGYVQNKATGRWAPDGGKIDHTKLVPPASFDQPIIWLPQDIDNSSGGQVWVDDPRWGPLSQSLLHSSFGKGHLFHVKIQELDDVAQAAVTRLPLDFSTGIMRGRVNPADGQVYMTGLNGWNGGGRIGLKDKGVFRVRYTEKPYRMIDDCQVTAEGLKLTFNFDLDQQTASNIMSFEGRQWNYKWTGNYGSPMFHPETGEEGVQQLRIENATVGENRRSIVLHTPDLRVVNQLHLHVKLNDANGKAFEDDVYWTINALP